MTHFAIAGLQLDLPERQNLDLVLDKTRLTLQRFPWVQMVVLSELAICGANPNRAEALPSDTERQLCKLAKELGIWYLPGSLFQAKDELVFNTMPVINPQGDVISRYAKMYPFYPYEKGVAEGQRVCTFEVPNVGRFGVSICYDIWFPELSRALIQQGAEVILHPSMTNTQDRDIEQAIVRATAAQNQCYVIDVNGAGEQGYGKSCLAGPDGEVIHAAGSGEEIMLVDVDFARIRRSRERGLMGLGQPLKSFRDAGHDFTSMETQDFLATLGPLEVPQRGSNETE
jgi:predicted amidohydrolase